MTKKQRSGCPVSLGLDVFGDRWTLLIIRDLMFSGKRHFRELIQSEEGISSNILADRLQMLLDEGVISRSEDQSHRQKVVYSLTAKGIELLPLLMQITHWSYKFRPVSERFIGETTADEATHPASWDAQMQALRRTHLGEVA